MGDPDAQGVLAGLYERGWGVPQDIARAARLYERSARQGFAPSQAMIAGLYLSGYGVQKDPERARYWFSQCARQGDAACAKSLRSLGGAASEPPRPQGVVLAAGPAAAPPAAPLAAEPAPPPSAPAPQKAAPSAAVRPDAARSLSPLQHLLIGALLGLCAACAFFLLAR